VPPVLSAAAGQPLQHRAELREALAARGLDTSGTKAVLEARLTAANEFPVKKGGRKRENEASDPEHRRKKHADVDSRPPSPTPSTKSTRSKRSTKSMKAQGGKTKRVKHAEEACTGDTADGLDGEDELALARSPIQLEKEAQADRAQASRVSTEAHELLDDLSVQLEDIKTQARGELAKLSEASKVCTKPLAATGGPATVAVRMAKAMEQAAEVVEGVSQRLQQLAVELVDTGDAAARAQKALQRAQDRTEAALEAQQNAALEAKEAKAAHVRKIQAELARAVGMTISVPKDHQTVQGAVDAAQDGDRVCISSGAYNEQVRIDKAIKITGAGPRSSIVLEYAGNGSTVHISGGAPRLSNLTIRYEGTKPHDAVTISGGEAEVHECDLRSSKGSGVHVKGGAKATVTWCNAHDNEQSGFLVSAKAFGIIEDCSAKDNLQAGYVVMEAGAELRRNIAVRNLGGIGIFGKGCEAVVECNQLKGNRQDNLHVDAKCKKKIKLIENVTL